jgi:thymidylate synthase
MDVDELVITATDAHLYHIHFEPAQIWLDRYDKITGKRVFSIDVGNIPEDDIEEYIKKVAKRFKKNNPNWENEDFFIGTRSSNVEEIDNTYCKAKININGKQKSIDDFKFEDFILENYKPQSYIKAQLLS